MLQGGFAIGSVNCLVEDSACAISDIFLKLFASQGLQHSHHVLMVGELDVKECPSISNPLDRKSDLGRTRNSSGSSGSDSVEKMKIAWRYEGQNLPAQKRLLNFCGAFDLSKRITKEELSMVDGCVLEIDVSSKNLSYNSLLHQIHRLVSGPYRFYLPSLSASILLCIFRPNI